MDFLRSISSKTAYEMLSGFKIERETETVSLEHAIGRVIAYDIVSNEDVPKFPRSLVDGYALKAKDTIGAKETSPRFLNVVGEVRVGEISPVRINDGESVRVSTGSMIPEGADGVIMQEYVRELIDSIEITKTVFQGENIVFVGNDIRKGDRIIERGKRLNFFDLGVLASLGIAKVDVYKKPLIGLISTGDEIIDIEETPIPGKIRDINRYVITGMLAREGFSVDFFGIAKDNMDEIIEKINLAIDTHIVIFSGGSSKGERDYIVDSIKRMGGEIIFHGINIKPGKPTIFARLKDRPVFGLPGHPASCAMVFMRFVLPFIKRMEGESVTHVYSKFFGILTTNIPSTMGIEECILVEVEKKDNELFVTPIFIKSSFISSFTKAKGYIVIPEEKEGLEKGEKVEVFSF